MVRVTDPSAGKIWLFSADTLSRIPDLYEQVEAHQVETHVPKVLVKWRFLGMPVWLWLALLVAIPIAAVLARILIEIVLFPLMWWRGVRKQPQLADWRKVSGPVWLVLGVMIHRILVSFLGMPLLHRHYYFITARVVFTIGLGWLTLRMLSRGMDRLRERAIARGEDWVLIDSRPRQEYQAGNIPGSIDAPAGQMLRCFDDLVHHPTTKVAVNCMSRTRGILGGTSLVAAGVPNEIAFDSRAGEYVLFDGDNERLGLVAYPASAGSADAVFEAAMMQQMCKMMPGTKKAM